jgi:peptidoglycan-N-acetylglucosamine deacetylase
VLLHDAGGDRRGTVEALRTILPNLVSRLRLEPLPAGSG